MSVLSAGYEEKNKTAHQQDENRGKRSACLLYWIIDAQIHRFTDCVVPGTVHAISDLA